MLTNTIYRVRNISARGVAMTTLTTTATDNVGCTVMLSVSILLAPEAPLKIWSTSLNRYSYMPYTDMGQ
jgi:hypothetical protein